MRVTESLIHQNKWKNKQRQRMRNEEEEPTQTYQKREQEYWAFNQSKTVFDSPMGEGINTQKSVFDKKAVFRTESREY